MSLKKSEGAGGDGVGCLVSSAERRVEDESGAFWALRIDWRHDEHIDGLSSLDNDVVGGIVRRN